MPEINDILKPTTKPKKKSPKETNTTTAVAVETTVEKAEEKNRRPPLEQITTDFESFLSTLKIDNKPIIKLGYKCGKIIYGLNNSDSKDFRVFAFKARKKSKSVNGKSRCIFYFGLDNYNLSLPATKKSKFGKCSVQSKEPIELTLDKTTFTTDFAQNESKVIDTLKKLAILTITEKSKKFIDKKKSETTTD